LAMLNVSTNLFIPETVRTENCAGNGIRRNIAVRTENCAGNGIRRNSAVTHNDLRVERIEIVQIRIVATFGIPTRDSEGDNVKNRGISAFKDRKNCKTSRACRAVQGAHSSSMHCWSARTEARKGRLARLQREQW